MKHNHEEHNLQALCIRWFRLQYPRFVMFAIPNAARRSPRRGAWMKAEGMLAGVPDLFLALPAGDYKGLFLETKIGDNKESKSQLTVFERLKSVGYCVIIYRTFRQFQSIISNYILGGVNK